MKILFYIFIFSMCNAYSCHLFSLNLLFYERDNCYMTALVQFQIWHFGLKIQYHMARCSIFVEGQTVYCTILCQNITRLSTEGRLQDSLSLSLLFLSSFLSPSLSASLPTHTIFLEDKQLREISDLSSVVRKASSNPDHF